MQLAARGLECGLAHFDLSVVLEQTVLPVQAEGPSGKDLSEGYQQETGQHVVKFVQSYLEEGRGWIG